MRSASGRREFARFCLVGGVGFAFDAGSTLIFVQTLGMSSGLARVAAFFIAATATWALNRHFTFKHSGPGGSWLQYILSTSMGALISLGVYLLWLQWAGKTPGQLLAGVALGSVVALFFNFSMSKWFIFKPSNNPDSSNN
jgi:putative flippase GtrA